MPLAVPCWCFTFYLFILFFVCIICPWMELNGPMQLRSSWKQQFIHYNKKEAHTKLGKQNGMEPSWKKPTKMTARRMYFCRFRGVEFFSLADACQFNVYSRTQFQPRKKQKTFCYDLETKLTTMRINAQIANIFLVLATDQQSASNNEIHSWFHITSMYESAEKALVADHACWHSRDRRCHSLVILCFRWLTGRYVLHTAGRLLSSRMEIDFLRQLGKKLPSSAVRRLPRKKRERRKKKRRRQKR